MESLFSMTTSEINALSEKDFNLACNAIENNEYPFEVDFSDPFIREWIRTCIKEGASVNKAVLGVIIEIYLDIR